MYTEIEYVQRDHVGIITIDRPEARNALTFVQLFLLPVKREKLPANVRLEPVW